MSVKETSGQNTQNMNEREGKRGFEVGNKDRGRMSGVDTRTYSAEKEWEELFIDLISAFYGVFERQQIKYISLKCGSPLLVVVSCFF
jgi:hypothetical protein